MKIEIDSPIEVPTQTASPLEENLAATWQRVVKRRSFLKNVGMVAAAVPAGAMLSGTPLLAAVANQSSQQLSSKLNKSMTKRAIL